MFLVLSGCPKRVVDFGPAGEPRDVDDLLARTRAAELSVVSVKGEAKLKAATAQGSGTAGLFVAVKEPAFIHLEALDFFGRPQAQLTTDGVMFGLYDAQAGKYFKGPATAANLARLVPVRLPPTDLAALLLGRVPRGQGHSVMGFEADRGVFKVEIVHQIVEIEPPSYRVTKSHALAYDVEMDSIEAVGAFTFPKHAVLSAGEQRMELSWKDVELNGALEDAMFDMTPPEGVPVVEVQ